MDLYTTVSGNISRLLTEQYSTSFSMSTRLFDQTIRADIYAIYGLVRIADEVVDTYRGEDANIILSKLEKDVYDAIKRGYDTNPIIHSFALTAAQYEIDASLIGAFFESMAMDLHPTTYTAELYQKYIYGSAEVIGLMCLRVFCGGYNATYESLLPGARALGSAYQKVNFLRDIAADYQELGRLYFPGVTYDTFDDSVRDAIVKDIEKDMTLAKKYVHDLPDNSRKAVSLSVQYYAALLRKIQVTPAEELKHRRIRVGTLKKIWFFIVAKLETGNV